jgi:NADH:ubiquinone oxidoreductase subunit 6 (subunit J)
MYTIYILWLILAVLILILAMVGSILITVNKGSARN